MIRPASRANSAASRRARGVIGIVLTLACIAGCQRKTTLVQEGPDSSVAVSHDSTTALLRSVQDAWDAQNQDDQAARLTARAMFEDLKRRAPGDWRGRAEELLDSLGVGVETGGGPCALMVNLFVRSDPARGSWPAIYWCDADGARFQEVEGKGMRLLGFVAHTDAYDSDGDEGVNRAAALFGRQRSGRQEPFLIVWSRAKKQKSWQVTQTLGPDSLGGLGSGDFTAPVDTNVDLVMRTYRTPPRFDECVTCPHMFQVHVFHWRPGGFARVRDEVVPSTYSTFVSFIDALSNNAPSAVTFVTTPAVLEAAHGFDLGASKGTWRIAPAIEETSTELTFFRGPREAYKVTFEPRGENWLIAGIESVPRSVE